ncbi:hypothetical protein MIND_00056700 [Mycena indigotica]|uniref:Uncharacterized protein n=1 Tax=Mycena indigotica TaxID=2126181 RepID=A0A8H6WE71_9AGAR|nr:uncharacterized protein MIND_00056700 [Mycena indigotica]KAF7315419.1 hypothetical protein MIND_00056700 [Mycena indigotica]
MSLSSYFKRQSRVLRNSTISAFGLTSILEEDTESIKTSVKAKRRHGVSDLRIPSLADFQAELPALNSSDDESSDGGLPTTPTSSQESFTGQAVIRCKSIKPLTVSKRSVSPVPTLSSEEEDDVYYAAHARGYITLRRSSSLTTQAMHRESAVIMPVSRRFSIPSRPPPPPPIDTSVPNFSRPTAVLADRPPPRTPVPTDAWSGDYTDATSFTASPSISSSGSSSPFSFSAASTSPSTSLDALLSPPQPQFPVESQSIPMDADDWEECAFDEDDVFHDIPLSPSPSPLSLGAPAIESICVPEPKSAGSPSFSEYTPSPRPRLSSHSQQLRSRWSSSTLSSVHSGRGATSPKTFAFARRYLRVKTPTLNLRSPSTPSPKPSPKRRSGKKRLTAKDVVVMHPQQRSGLESPPPPSTAQTDGYPSSP